MKIILLILILAKTSCQEDKAVKIILASSASRVLAGGIYDSIILLDESADYSMSKIKSINDVQKFYLKKGLILAGTFGISKALGFSNESAAVITGSSIVASIISSRIKKLKNCNYNLDAFASATIAGLILTRSYYKSLGKT